MFTKLPKVQQCTVKELLDLFREGKEFENWSDEQINALTITKGEKHVFYIREDSKISSVLVSGYLVESAQYNIIGLSDCKVGPELLTEKAYSSSPTGTRLVTSLLVDKKFAKSHLKAFSKALKMDNKKAITIIVRGDDACNELIDSNMNCFRFSSSHKNIVCLK